MEISREETIYGSRTRHQITGHTKAVVTKDGQILSRKMEAFANNGGYASHGHAICANCGNVFKELYIDKIGTEVDCWTVYTNAPTAGAMRGYGIPQSVWITECLTDDLARKIGMDPLEIRLKNCIPAGFKDPHNGITFHSYGLKEAMLKGAELANWKEKRVEYDKPQSGDKRRAIRPVFILSL